MHLFVCHTYYHLYVALVLSYLEHKKGKKTQITLSLTRNVYKPEFFERLQTVGWTEILDLTNQALVQRISGFNATQKVLLNLFLGFAYQRLNPAVHSIPLDHCRTLYLFNDFHYLTRYVLKKASCEAVLVEDGNNNYTPDQSSFPIVFLKKMLGLHPPYGRHPNFKTILVERPHNLPRDIAHKGRKLGLQDKAQRLPRDAQQQIHELFLDFDPGTISSDSVLVLTQPLFDFGRITFEQHLQVYSNIVNYFQDKGYPVYLKPHPSDTVIYTKHFPQATILPQSFPIEIFNTMSHIRFRLALGVNTSAVYHITFADERISLLAYDESIKANFSNKLQKIEQELKNLDL